MWSHDVDIFVKSQSSVEGEVLPAPGPLPNSGTSKPKPVPAVPVAMRGARQDAVKRVFVSVEAPNVICVKAITKLESWG